MNRADFRIHRLPEPDVADQHLAWAVVLADFNGQWLLVRHRQRSTFEAPGGKREPGESVFECATRELIEEASATEFTLDWITNYSIRLPNGTVSFGSLFHSNVASFSNQLCYETSEILVAKTLPNELTYPFVLPQLVEFLSANKQLEPPSESIHSR